MISFSEEAMYVFNEKKNKKTGTETFNMAAFPF